MALDPQIADILDRVQRAGRPAFCELSASQARTSYKKAARILEIAPIAMARVDDFAIRARDAYALPVRLYVPEGLQTDAPLVLFCHGGGFIVGDLDTHDSVCRMIAARTPCLVLAVDYRLAPEWPFPSAVEDAWDAFSWVYGNARRLGASPLKLALVGDSAGGTLAAVNAIRARDAGLNVRIQVLIYPGTAGHQDSDSHRRLTEGYLLDAKTIQWFFQHYLRDAADRDDWRFAPLDAKPSPDLGDVAPACILVAGYDPLHDEGVAYATRLRESGVEVALLDYPGMVHGFFNLGGAVDVAREAHKDVVGALKRAFGSEAESNRDA